VDELIEERCEQRLLATGDAATEYSAPIWEGGVAVIIGSEGHGASAWGERLATGGVRIDLEPGVESLNAAIAGAVILFEARRQRRI
jgi:TrmH family RNA methyltransferase